MKIALRLFALVAAVLIVAVAALMVVGIPPGVMNAMVGDRMARETGTHVAFDGATRIGLFPLHLTAHDVSIVPPGDDAVGITVERIEADISLSSLLSGEPNASTVTLTRPLLRAPLVRDRARNSVTSPSSAQPSDRIPVQHVIVTDGAVLLSDPIAKVEQRIDGISVDLQVAADRRVTMTGQARFGAAPSSFTVRTRWPTTADSEAIAARSLIRCA